MRVLQAVNAAAATQMETSATVLVLIEFVEFAARVASARAWVKAKAKKERTRLNPSGRLSSHTRN